MKMRYWLNSAKMVLLCAFCLIFGLIACAKKDSTSCDAHIKSLLNYECGEGSGPSLITFEPSKGKRIIYLATEHVNDKNHPLTHVIRKTIEDEKPDFCILEGFDQSEGINSPRFLEMAHAIHDEGRFAESTYAALLCEQHNIPFIGGDARESDYLKPLEKEGFMQRDVVFFLLAHYFPHLQRDGVTQDQLASYAEDILTQSIPYWLGTSIPYTYQDFLRWHEEHMGHPLDLEKDFAWGYEVEQFTPRLTKDASIYQRIQAHVMPIRDLYSIKTICQALEQYSRVFVIFGAGHYEWQKGALRYLFGEPIKREFL